MISYGPRNSGFFLKIGDFVESYFNNDLFLSQSCIQMEAQGIDRYEILCNHASTDRRRAVISYLRIHSKLMADFGSTVSLPFQIIANKGLSYRYKICFQLKQASDTMFCSGSLMIFRSPQ